MLRRNEKRFDKMLTTSNKEGRYDLQCPHWAAGVPTLPSIAGHLANIHSLFPAHQQDFGVFQAGNVSAVSVTSQGPLQLKLAM